jgi:branched-chain amino acid transport system permease protein
MIQSAIAGLFSGGAYALLGICVVLLYRMVGVLNLAQAAVGVFGAYIMTVLAEIGLPIWLALLLGLISSGLIGALLGLVMVRWFSEAPVQTRSSVTIAMLIGILTAGWRSFGTDPRPVPILFNGFNFEVSGVVVPFMALAVIALAVILAVGIDLFLRRTRTGLQLRALAERSTAAELLGVPAPILAIVMIAPTRAPDFTVLSMLILPAMAAALVGLFKSFRLTILGGLMIGLIEGMASQLEVISPFRQALWFVVMLAALVWAQRKEVWDAAR